MEIRWLFSRPSITYSINFKDFCYAFYLKFIFLCNLFPGEIGSASRRDSERVGWYPFCFETIECFLKRAW